MSKVYCKRCKHIMFGWAHRFDIKFNILVNDLDECHACRLTKRLVDGATKDSPISPMRCPYVEEAQLCIVKNKNNDCKEFEKSFWSWLR